MNEYTICSRCNEKPAAICLSCLTDCTLKQQPSVGEFTKKNRSYFTLLPEEECNTLIEKAVRHCSLVIQEACDRLDRAEARSIDCPNRPASKIEVEMAKRLCDYQDEIYELKKQPSAGEFTKKLKLRLPNMLPDSYEGMKSLCATLTDTVNETCNIIDTSEARLKDLLDACEAVKLRISFIGLPSEPMNEDGPDWSKEIALLEAVISKAKKEGE